MKNSPHEDHPSQDGTDRHALDRLLRLHGFKIYSRPSKGQSLWKDSRGKVLTKKQALHRLKKLGLGGDIKDAERDYEIYLDSLGFE